MPHFCSILAQVGATTGSVPCSMFCSPQQPALLDFALPLTTFWSIMRRILWMFISPRQEKQIAKCDCVPAGFVSCSLEANEEMKCKFIGINSEKAVYSLQILKDICKNL